MYNKYNFTKLLSCPFPFSFPFVLIDKSSTSLLASYTNSTTLRSITKLALNYVKSPIYPSNLLLPRALSPAICLPTLLSPLPAI